MKKHLLLLFLLLPAQVWGTTYYTDYQCSNGTAYVPATRACTGGSATVRQTVIGGIGLLSAGDTLYIRAGTYVEWLNNSIPSGGGEGSRTVVSAYEAEVVTLQPGAVLRVIYISDRSYITVAKLILDAVNVSSTGLTLDDVSVPSNITIQGCTIKNSPASGVFCSGSNHIIVSCSFDNNGADDGDHDIYAGVGVTGLAVYDCTFANGTGNAVQLYSGLGTQTINNNSFYRNVAYDKPSSMFVVADGENNVVYNNVGYRCRDLVRVWYSAHDTFIYSNTVYNMVNSGITVQADGGASGVTIKNNLISTSTNYGVYVGHQTTGVVVNNNLFDANVSGDVIHVCTAASCASSTDILNGSAAGTTAADNLDAASGMTNPAAGDFTLATGSAAINAGATLGTPYNVDILGVSRPQGAAYDIGAYEYPVAGPSGKGGFMIIAQLLKWRY